MRPRCYKSLSLLASVVLAVTAGRALGEGWPEYLDRALAMEEGPARERLVDGIVRARPEWTEVAEHIRKLEFGPPAATGAILDSTVCTDGVTRPYVLHVPETYDPAKPTPLLVRLHGGVGTAGIESDPITRASDNAPTQEGWRRGWLVLNPFGQRGATWWDEVGMANIRNLVRMVKRKYNVDDDRVYMGGFSDGGSGSFSHAMVAPSDYAAFLALNGHMGVASISGELLLYAPNMSNTPIYATTTFEDRLYPSHKMRLAMNMALEAGADILYKEFEGEHDFEDIESDLEFMMDFLERHIRDPFPSRIVWEADDGKYGQCRWFAIEKTTTAEPEPWHVDYNVALTDDRITFGFMVDWDYEEPGILVESVIEKSAAEAMGLLAGDVIVRSEEARIDSMDDLNAYKTTLKRGGPFGLTVRRGDELVVLRGQLPEPENYLIFKRSRPSARADVTFYGNHIDVRASRLGAFSVLVHPDMVNLEENLTIAVNGEVVYDRRVEPDIRFMIENFLENRDRQLLYVASVEVELDEKEVYK